MSLHSNHAFKYLQCKLTVPLSNLSKGPVYETLSGLEEVLQRQYISGRVTMPGNGTTLFILYTMQYVYCVMHGLSMAYKKIDPNSCSVQQNEIKSFRDVLASFYHLCTTGSWESLKILHE